MRLRLPAFRLCIAALISCASCAMAEENQAQEQGGGEQTRAELVYEFDPYYTSIGYNFSLTDKPIPTLVAEREAAIYRELVKDSLVPRYMLLEASVYPVPWLFTWIKSDMPELYQQAEVGDSRVNLFRSATAGFQEPWAVSLFFGNMAKLKRPGEKREGTNWGYTGYLVSAGTKHIKDNSLVDDDWYEVEWKIKGRREYADEKLTWSFRVGAKFNSHPEVEDVAYLGLQRSNVDFRYSLLEWLENTNYELRTHWLQQGGEVVRVEAIAGKNFPMPEWRFTPTLDFGVVWTSPNEYSGALRDLRGNELTLVLRPSIKF